MLKSRDWEFEWRLQYPESNCDQGGMVLTLRYGTALVSKVVSRDTYAAFGEAELTRQLLPDLIKLGKERNGGDEGVEIDRVLFKWAAISTGIAIVVVPWWFGVLWLLGVL